jgi:hypothetical protein
VSDDSLYIMTRIAEMMEVIDKRTGDLRPVDILWMTSLTFATGEVAEEVLNRWSNIDRDSEDLEAMLTRVAAVSICWIEALRQSDV